MATIQLRVKGNFNNTEKFLKLMSSKEMYKALGGLAETGVQALASATPKDSGLTAASWDYRIEITQSTCTITWMNHNLVNGWYSVAIGLQYGHGTGTGGWVSGQDYINPAIRPVFDKITEEVWKVVTHA